MIWWVAFLLWFFGCSEETKTSYDNKADGIVGDPIVEISESLVIEENQSEDGEPVAQVLEGNQSIIAEEVLEEGLVVKGKSIPSDENQSQEDVETYLPPL